MTHSPPLPGDSSRRGRAGTLLTVATAVAAALAAALLLLAPAARAQTVDFGGARRAAAAPMALAKATPEQLKAAYLQCDRLAMSAVLDSGTAATCSVIYETLKQRVFGGDFHRLLEWSRAQSPVTAAAPR